MGAPKLHQVSFVIGDTPSRVIDWILAYKCPRDKFQRVCPLELCPRRHSIIESKQRRPYDIMLDSNREDLATEMDR